MAVLPAWFARVGIPLTPGESADVARFVASAGLRAAVAIDAIATWRDAGRWLRLTDHDAAWWDEEEEERESLWAHATHLRSESELLQLLDTMTAGLAAEINVSAHAAATTGGMPDDAMADAAIAMALLAAHQNALARVAGAGPEHRFIRKYALFERGRWPLGYHAARFAIF